MELANKCLDQYTIDQYTFNNYCTPRECVDYALKYEHRDADRFIVSYPRSGSKWIQYIVQLIMAGGDREVGLNEGNYTLESMGREAVDRQSGTDLAVFKTHLPLRLLPVNDKARYLLAVRNPKDVIVSEYCLMREMGWHREVGQRCDFRDYFDYYHRYYAGGTGSGGGGGGKQCWYCGDQYDYVRQYWHQLRDQPNYTVLVYEDMVSDPWRAIEKIAQFLGDQYVRRLSEVMVDPEGNCETLVDSIARQSSITAMRAKFRGDPRVRKGVVGEWRRYFSRDESLVIDERVRREWSGLMGLESLWEREMRWE
ncbi:3-alpha-hydroxysteroid sulfotransferase-like [Oppia nitens]|uniref:3-alpha-hydroxysteroid sulfotransferase-like n=1 Tax=Oppia nitens TaxID=1686743 RepID=UPI0023D982FC|nr:3-alpha-hydroxysteroid sulfotransferase-like [Oppia nitens]